MGRFSMGGTQGGPLALLKRLRGAKKSGGKPGGADQMKMLRRIPQLLRFIPGTAQDVRAYFLTLQYWLAGSEENIANMVRFLVGRYAAGPRARCSARRKRRPPIDYPEVGRLSSAHAEPRSASMHRSICRQARATAQGTVGLLVMRSYVLAGNAAHYDGVIAALEARGLRVIPGLRQPASTRGRRSRNTSSSRTGASKSMRWFR